MATRAPSSARRSAMPRPMRLAAPVTRIVLPLRLGFIDLRKLGQKELAADERGKTRISKHLGALGLCLGFPCSSAAIVFFTPSVRHGLQSPRGRRLRARVRAAGR